MSCDNPMGDGQAIALAIRGADRPFLRRVLVAARDGLREDLNQHDHLCEPRRRLRSEEAAYVALVDAIDCGRVVPRRELRATLSRLAESVDHDNEYQRVVAEHDALHGLLCQLEGRRT